MATMLAFPAVGLPPDLLAELESGTPAAFVTDSRRRIVLWNRGAARLIQRSAREVLGRRCHQVIQGHDIFGNRYCQSVCPVNEVVRAGGAPRPFELRVPCPNWTDEPVRVTPMRVPGPRPDLYFFVHLLEDARLSATFGKRGFAPAADTPPRQPGRVASPLTPREADVLRHVARGLQNKEIAADLGLSPATVRNHLHAVLEKMGVHTRSEAVFVAHQRGWMDLPSA